MKINERGNVAGKIEGGYGFAHSTKGIIRFNGKLGLFSAVLCGGGGIVLLKPTEIFWFCGNVAGQPCLRA